MEWEYDAGAHLERIMGTHVVEYMNDLIEEDPERFKVQFAKYTENDIEPDAVEDLWKECHEKIRENPDFKPAEKQNITHKRSGNKIVSSDGSEYVRKVKMTKAQKHSRVAQKTASAQKRMMAAMEEDDE